MKIPHLAKRREKTPSMVNASERRSSSPSPFPKRERVGERDFPTASARLRSNLFPCPSFRESQRIPPAKAQGCDETTLGSRPNDLYPDERVAALRISLD